MDDRGIPFHPMSFVYGSGPKRRRPSSTLGTTPILPGAKTLVADATASRVSSKSKSYRCHAPVANPSSNAFTFRGHQHEEIANDHHN